MLQLRKGVRLESLNLPLKRALIAAAQLGAAGVEINARTEVKPSDLTRTGVRHIKKLLNDHRLSVCCLHFPTRRGYDVADDLDRRVEATKAALSMAYDLGCPVVSNFIGAMPPTDSPAAQTLRDALEEIGRHGQRVGATLAARTGPHEGERLAEWIRALDPGTLGVDFDPAGLVINKHDVEATMRAVGASVLHFRARDAVRDLSQEQGLEVQMGRGSVDLPPLLAILEEHDYHGFITVDRQPGTQSAAQCAEALEYLENLFL